MYSRIAPCARRAPRSPRSAAPRTRRGARTSSTRSPRPRASPPRSRRWGRRPTRAAHPAGGVVVGDARGTCGDCQWRAGVKCRQLGKRVAPDAPACERYEAVGSVDCQTCGACCREAYHAVEVAPKDPFVKKHPELVVLRRENQSGHLDVKRAGDRCAALGGGDGDPATPYACAVYADRPRTCRDFTLGSDNCLTARRRVGLSL